MSSEVIEAKAFIGGKWVEASSGERYEVHYPGDGRLTGTAPVCTREDVDMAVAAAKDAAKELKRMSLLKRIELLHKALEVAREKSDYSGRLVCLESGKPISQAVAEGNTLTGYSWGNFHVAMANVKSFRGQTLPNVTEDSNDKRISYRYEPLDVVANISTFSYPSEMPNCTIPYALALGCAVVLKPSRSAPFTGALLAEIIDKAGFPPGSLNVVTGPGKVVGDHLVAHSDVEAIHFFGQEETAETISAKAGFKKRLMAVVSNNPLIVMDDANIDAAVTAAVNGAFNHNGLSPISTGRVLVHKEVYTTFKDKFLEVVKKLVVADPLVESCHVGPLNNQTLLDKALNHLEDAEVKGARILAGGNNPKGLYLEPTVIEDVVPEMLVASETTPGPIAPLIIFDNRDEAIELANATRYGFQAGIFTSSLSNAFYLSENVQAGSVYVNEATNCWDEMSPFGGVKRSGTGRMLSDWIFMELSQIKMTLFDLGKVKA